MVLKISDIDLSWKEEYISSFLPIILALFFFSCYWFIANSEKIKQYFYDKYDFDTASYRHIFFTKIVGFISMGVVPVIFCLLFIDAIPFEKYGVTFIPQTALFSLAWILGLSAVLIPIAYYSAKNPKNLLNYPQIRSKIWTNKIVLINASGWLLYLFGYEFLFRGVLLVPLVQSLGVWPAIAVNIALYSATHIPKGLDETIGAIPLGLVLCMLTLLSGTIWIAFIVHVVMAWTNCFTALYYHPEIHYAGSSFIKKQNA